MDPLPATPATVALYITAVAAKGLKPSTIRRRLASISVAHQVAGFDTPTTDAGVRAVWSGIRRHHGTAPRKIRAARTKIVTAMVAPLGDGLADARDRTLLLFGFAGALRRSELVALDVEDVSEDDAGLRLILRKSKTDQEAEGAIRGLPYGSHPATCPVRAWRRGLTTSGIETGPAFRSVDRHGRLGAKRLSDRAVADMIKRRALAVGLDRAFRRSLPTRQLRHRGLRPGHPRAGHHAPRPLAIGIGDAGLHRGRRPLERQRRAKLGL